MSIHKDEALRTLATIHARLAKDALPIQGHALALLRCGIEFAIEEVQAIEETQRPRRPRRPSSAGKE